MNACPHGTYGTGCGYCGLPAAEPTDEVYDAADAITEVLTAEPQTPSALARKAKIPTQRAHDALRWMARHRYAVAEGNGAWTRYRTRRAGERIG